MSVGRSMTVIYSFGARVGAEGLGRHAYEDAHALYRHGALQRLLCGFIRRTEIPADRIRALGWRDRVLRKLCAYDSTQSMLHLQNLHYDRWASRQLVPADVFVVWNSYGLRSLRQAKARGMTTVVIRASTHPLYSEPLLAEEYTRCGASYHRPRVRQQRTLAELDTADYVLIPTDSIRRTYTENGVAESRLLILPGLGVDVHTYRPVPRRRAAPFRVLFVGSLGVRKGVPYLLQAWEQLKWRAAELRLVGQVTPEIEPTLRRCRQLPGVRVIGHVRDPLPFFQDADVFVLPSLEEGSARVTYEAMACGLPVITTAEAGSQVRDGREGFIVPVRSVDALAGRLEQLRTDERLRDEMGRAARLRAQCFTWDAYGAALVRMLAELTQRSGRAAAPC